MSGNIRAKAAAGRGRGRGKAYNKVPPRKAFTSNHADEAMKTATFDMGQVVDATQFVKSMETYVNYVGRSGRNHTDELRQILNGSVDTLPTIPLPMMPTQAEQDANALVATIYLEDRKTALKKQDKLDVEIKQLYDEMMDQCSDKLKNKLKGEEGYAAMELARNPLELRNRIKRICCGFDAHKEEYYAITQAMRKFILFYQAKGMSNVEFHRQLNALWDTVEQFGGDLGYNPALIAKKANELAVEAGRVAADGAPEPIDEDVVAATAYVKSKIKACFTLSAANNERYATLKDHLENAYITGDDKYPNNSEDVIGLLDNFRIGDYQPRQRVQQTTRDEDGVAFVQEGQDNEDDAGENMEEGAAMAQGGTPAPKKKRDINDPQYKKKFKEHRCYHCGEYGHIATDCPGLSEADRAVVNAQFGYSALQGGMVKSNYLYLDTCTTDDYVPARTYLTDIYRSKTGLRLQTNAGSTVTHKKGMLGSIEVWHGEHGGANVTRLRTMEDLCRRNGGKLYYDSEKNGGAFVADLGNGPTIYFKRCPITDFPFIDLDEHCDEGGAVMLLSASATKTSEGSTNIQSVARNMEGYTKREVVRAVNARDDQAMMAYINEGDMKAEVSRKILGSSDISRADISRSNQIFGPRAHQIIRGKERRRKPSRVEPEYCSIPQSLVDKCKYVTLVGDVMFVCGMPFFISMSRGIRFVTAQYRPHRTAKLLANALKETIDVYKRAGFVVQTCLMDNEFEPLKRLMNGVCNINTTARNEHVGEIERLIQTIKGKGRCIVSDIRDVGITHLPFAVIKKLITFVVMWTNAIFTKHGVSDEFSPREIILRWQLSKKKHMKARFGAYCEVSDEPDITNTQEDRSTPAMCLGPTGNFQGTYQFFNLNTGEVIKRRNFNVLPYPTRMIKKVNEWGLKNKQEAKLSFKNRNNKPFSWEDDEEDLIQDNAVEPELAPYPGVLAEMPQIRHEDDIPVTAVEPVPGPTEEDQINAASDNANFGPRDVPVVEPDDSAAPAVREVTYNLTFDVPGAIPAQPDEFDDSAADDDDDFAAQQEWDGQNDQDQIHHDQDQTSDHDFQHDLANSHNDASDTPQEDTQDEALDEADIHDTGSDSGVAAPTRRRRRQRYDDVHVRASRSRRSRRVTPRTSMNLVSAGKPALLPRNGAGRAVVRAINKKKVSWAGDLGLLSSKTVRNIKHAFSKESNTEEAQTFKNGRSEIRRRVRYGRTKKKFVPKDGWKPKPKRKKFKSARRARRWLRKRAASDMPWPKPGDEVDMSPIEVEEGGAQLFGIILAQLSLKQGMREFGEERADESIMKEFQMLHDQKCWIPRDPATLTKEERIKALSTVVFMKEKRDGRIKTRSCVNGAPQREYIKKEDAASPTVATDSVFITGVINAEERRDCMTFDIPGAFVTTKTDEYVIMCLRGHLCEIMTRIDPKLYRKHITKDKKGNPVLYVQLYKSLYGLLRSALLFYKKFKSELEAYGFEMNPYDPCVFNRTTDKGNQHTVIFHVDDGLSSCVEAVENTKLLIYLSKIYGDSITFTRSKKFDYLGMDMDYSEDGVLGVSMIPYIDNIEKEFPEAITRTSPTPAAEYLFKVREEGVALLDEDRAMAFHRTVAQLLFLCMRARRDIQTAVAFLTTRVKQPDEDDWGKIKRVLQYLKGTRSLKLRLSIDNLQCTKWLVDAAHGVHNDMKGHTGAAMTLGDGAVISMSVKHKQNAKSSTEDELYGVDNAMPKILWSLEFIRAQGYDVKHALLYQDNRSAILLEINGKLSSSKKTKHIKMKYFFIKDQVDQGEVKVEHLGTKDMWVDTLSKPKQGKAYRLDRSKLMNCPVDWQEPGVTCSRPALKDISKVKPMPIRAVNAK